MILVVDDEPDNAEVVRQILELEGYHVTTAGGCDEALELIAEQIPDLLITDVRMPGRSGLEFLEVLRESKMLKRIPVILLSGLRKPTDVSAGLDAGAWVYLMKPFDPQEMLTMVGTILETQGSRRHSDDDIVPPESNAADQPEPSFAKAGEPYRPIRILPVPRARR